MADTRQARISGGHSPIETLLPTGTEVLAGAGGRTAATGPDASRAATVSTAFRQCYDGAPDTTSPARLYESPVTGAASSAPGTTTQTMASRGAPR
ncbi:hypothetical protein [Streptomyces liangshanensis]|uniref:Uncharacterized protein n=1 Tax=Streptomyces liangshanensis TaxID=2717324 RepID=A0A6G9GTX2_9ACTN|nr:hypothetical protein [Streptomyces liangshanensis]QIQ01712.1 hypothetical protein HA039_04910 [Streptomyces liangshanensis]